MNRIRVVVGLFAAGIIIILAATTQDVGSQLPQDLFAGQADDVSAEQWTPEDSIGGYASLLSVVQGGSIAFHISTDETDYTLSIWREGATRQQVMTTTTIAGTGDFLDCTGGYAPPGCGWPAVYTLTVPSNWESGVYTVDIPTVSDGTHKIVFWVREDTPGSTSDVLFLAAVNTYAAYTNFGGKSIYNYNSTDETNADVVSFNRPFRFQGLGDYGLEAPLVEWMDAQTFTVEYAAESDLDIDANLLDPYEVLVIAGHSEYWSWDMRQRLKTFLQNGGRLINLSGNTFWWQVRYEDNYRTMVGYKEDAVANDPESPSQELTTNNPWDFPIYDVESLILGTQWRLGGFALSDNKANFQYSGGYGGYWVQNDAHWVFTNTNLSNGQIFGRTDSASTSIIGPETDGVAFNCAADGSTIIGAPVNSGVPGNFTILAIAPAELTNFGYAVMGIYTLPGGGAVFSASTIDWAQALAEDSSVEQITRNVFDRFLAGNIPTEPDYSDASYYFYDRFNCNNLNVGDGFTDSSIEWYKGIPSHSYTVPNGAISAVSYTTTCGFNGTGLQAPLGERFWFNGIVKPDWSSVDTLYTRIYLDFSNMNLLEDKRAGILDFFYDADGEASNAESLLASLSFVQRDDGLYLDYNPTQGDGNSITQVITSTGFVRVETLWDKANNQIAVWIEDTEYSETVDLSGVDGINKVTLKSSPLAEDGSGFMCMDEFAFDDARIGSASFEPPDDSGDENLYLPSIEAQ